ncbi:hypothetical protein P9112_009323 [Eukaryota sp. TZLM1-RC]
MCNIDQLIEEVKQCKTLSYENTKTLCYYVMEMLQEEPTVLELSSPLTVCGDIHGQFFDLLKLFEVGGQVDNTRYLFLGDFVDRGYYSLETITLLLLYKVKYPDRIFLLRGNHETRAISSAYGFYDDCLRHFGCSLPWSLFMEVFDVMALAAVVDGKYLCVHGGLSPDIRTVDQLRMLPRCCEVPTSGPASDVVWSDPISNPNVSWQVSPRGAGYEFGEGPAIEFLHGNDLKMLVRAHQLVATGFEYLFDKKCVTVWSAPNYCYRCGNEAAIMSITDDGEHEFKVFKEAPANERKTPAFSPMRYFL